MGINVGVAMQTEPMDAVTVLALSQRNLLAIAETRADLGDVLSRVGAKADLSGDGCSGRLFDGVTL